MSQNYKTGTVTVTAGSVHFTGIGTAWDLALVTGGVLYVEGQAGGAPIDEITSDNAGIFELPWHGSTGTFDYVIVRETAQSASAIIANDRLARITYRLETGTFIDPDGTGTLAERAQYDEAAQGFVFIQSDVDPFLCFIKESAADGDWSVGQPLRGDKGDDGDPGVDGIGDAFDIVFDSPGKAGAGETFKMLFARAVSFPVGLAGSVSASDVAATATTVWTFQKNGVTFGTLTTTAGQTVGTFASAAGAFFVSPNEIEIVAPTPQDATHAGVRFTLAGSR